MQARNQRCSRCCHCVACRSKGGCKGCNVLFEAKEVESIERPSLYIGIGEKPATHNKQVLANLSKQCNKTTAKVIG